MRNCRSLAHAITVAALFCFVLARAPASAATADSENEAQTVVVTAAERATVHVGAGVVVAHCGASLIVVTAAHVLSTRGLQVTTANGENLTVLKIDRLTGFDLAVLTTSPYFGRVFTATIGQPVLGEPVHVWGHRAVRSYVESAGSIVDLDPVLPEGPADGIFAIDCSQCDHGDSGAGVFDAAGRLVGILEGARTDETGKIAFIECEPLGPALAAIGVRS